jgi:hypothetical protein
VRSDTVLKVDTHGTPPSQPRGPFDHVEVKGANMTADFGNVTQNGDYTTWNTPAPPAGSYDGTYWHDHLYFQNY